MCLLTESDEHQPAPRGWAKVDDICRPVLWRPIPYRRYAETPGARIKIRAHARGRLYEFQAFADGNLGQQKINLMRIGKAASHMAV